MVAKPFDFFTKVDKLFGHSMLEMNKLFEHSMLEVNELFESSLR